MTRVDEIEARWAGSSKHPDKVDIDYLLAEVKRLAESRRGIIEIMMRADIRGNEQQARADKAETERDAALRALAIHHKWTNCPACGEWIADGEAHHADCPHYAADMAARKLVGELHFDRDQPDIRRHDATELRNLALSLAEALKFYATGWGDGAWEDGVWVTHADKDCGARAEKALSDPRLAKIRGK